MKLFKQICAILCLLGFAFSIIQFLPVKSLLQKTELCKKVNDCKKETEDDNEKDSREKDDETDTDNEISDLIHQLSEIAWMNTIQNAHFYHRSDLPYHCALSKIPTPPPEV